MKLLSLFIFFISYTYSQVESVLETTYIIENEIKSTEVSEEISQDQISELHPNSIDEIFKESNSVTTEGGPRKISENIQIRGLKANKLFFKIDGVRQNFRTDHSSTLLSETENLKAIGISKSPLDNFSNGSPGGGIELKTLNASDLLDSNKSWGVIFKTAYQKSNSEDTFNTKLFNREGKLESLLSLTSRNASNQQLSDKRTLPNSAFQDKDLFLKFKYKENERNTIAIKVESFSQENQAPLNPSLFTWESLDNLNGINFLKKESVSLNYDYKKSQAINSNFLLYSNNQEIKKIRQSDSYEETRQLETNGLSAKNTSKFKNSTLDLKAEYFSDTVQGVSSNSNINSYPDGESKQIIVSSSLDYNFKRLTITPMLRLNHYDVQGNNGLNENSSTRLSKGLKLKLSLAKGLNIETSCAEGFNAPRVQEIYVDGLHSPAVEDSFIAANFFQMNTSLRPEKSKICDAGIEYKNSVFSNEDQLSFSIHRFQNNIDDYIYLNRVDQYPWIGTGTTQFINLERAKNRGTEWSLKYLNNIFEASVSYSRYRGTKSTFFSYLETTPADQYLSTLKLYLEEYGLSFGTQITMAMEQNKVNSRSLERTEETPGYTVYSVFFNKEFEKSLLKGLSLNSRIDNLSNKTYRRHASNIMEAGLDFKLALSYQYNFL